MFELAPKIIEDGLDKLGQKLAANQSSKGLTASGKSARSLRVSVVTADTTITGQLIGADYWYYQEHGRGPGKYAKPSRAFVEIIRVWLLTRGIKAPAYAVAYNINRYGVKVPNRYNSGGVVSEILNADTASKEILPRLRQMAFNDIQTAIFKPI